MICTKKIKISRGKSSRTKMQSASGIVHVAGDIRKINVADKQGNFCGNHQTQIAEKSCLGGRIIIVAVHDSKDSKICFQQISPEPFFSYKIRKSTSGAIVFYLFHVSVHPAYMMLGQYLFRYIALNNYLCLRKNRREK